MSNAVTISKLESLLARIKTRAAAPRHASVPAAVSPSASIAAAPAAVAPVAAARPMPAPVAAAPPMPAPAPPPAPARAWAPPVAVAPPAAVTPPVAVAPPAARAPISEPPLVDVVDEPTTLPPPAPVSSDLDFAVDVDVSSGTPEPVSAAPPPLVQSAPPAAVSEAPDAGPAIEQHVEMLADDDEFAGTEDDKMEEAPASSRRPVTSPPERLAELAFDAEESESPRHTPPKSGRLPAPPAVEFDADVTGVRPAATVSVSHEDEVTPPSAPGAVPSVLSPQAVRADFAASAHAPVADVIGQAQRFAPATFLTLLDASLSL